MIIPFYVQNPKIVIEIFELLNSIILCDHLRGRQRRRRRRKMTGYCSTSQLLVQFSYYGRLHTILVIMLYSASNYSNCGHKASMFDHHHHHTGTYRNQRWSDTKMEERSKLVHFMLALIIYDHLNPKQKKRREMVVLDQPKSIVLGGCPSTKHPTLEANITPLSYLTLINDSCLWL